jgi:hypothetical protein
MEKEFNLKKYLSDDQIEIVANMFEKGSYLTFEEESLVLQQVEGCHSLSWMMAHAFICGAKFSRNFLTSINLEE